MLTQDVDGKSLIYPELPKSQVLVVAGALMLVFMQGLVLRDTQVKMLDL
jgi:hypothetical protein